MRGVHTQWGCRAQCSTHLLVDVIVTKPPLAVAIVSCVSTQSASLRLAANHRWHRVAQRPPPLIEYLVVGRLDHARQVGGAAIEAVDIPGVAVEHKRACIVLGCAKRRDGVVAGEHLVI
eukprot:scaffold139009_cov29-Tisochrysis_lutea.AAC.7